MVLEGYLSRFLVERFGRYVKGLDAENLRLSAWKGEILLKGLQLVPEALSEELDIPVDVKWGHVGLFHLSVPWSKLGSKPVRATLEDVYILVAPLDTWSMDDMERQRRARYQKSRGVEWRLRKHLERKASLMEGASNAEGAAGGKGRWGRLLAKILDNVQITVKNIHIRYEDELSLEDVAAAVPRPLSAGVTLRELVVQTVDEHWTPTYVQQDSGGGKGDDSEGFVYKLVSVDSLAVYCDEEVPPPPSRPSGAQPTAPSTGETAGRGNGRSTKGKTSEPVPTSSPSLLSDGDSTEKHGGINLSTSRTGGGSTRDRCFLAAGLTDEDLEGMFRTSLAEGEDRHSYVVIPASPFFRLRMQRDGGDGGGGMCSSSKYKVQAFFNEVGLVLNNSQIANINKMRSTLRDLERWEALYRHRPKHKIKDGPKAWWVYLVKCVSRPGKADKRAKLGWLDVARLLSLRKLYVRLYTARARHQATPEEYKQFTRLDEQLTANEIVAFRVKAIAELEEQEEAEALLSSSSSNLTVPAGEQAIPRQTWGQWLLRREPAPAAAVVPAPAAGNDDDGADEATAAGGGGVSTAVASRTETGSGAAAGAASQREDAAAQAEFLRAFSSSHEGGLEGDADGADEHKQRVLFDVEASLNEGALTLVNAGQPCLRIIFDVKAELQKKKSDWRLELGLGALQAFGLAGQGAPATTLLTRRTWKPPEAVGIGGGDMIQIGDFQVWKSGGIVVDYQSEDPDRVVPADPARKAFLSPQASPRGDLPGAERVGVVADQVISGSGAGGESTIGDRGGSVVTVKVVFAPHQLMHSRACVDQVTSMLATKDMRLLTSAAQSKISRLQRATRSSFLHALGSSQRVEVTADIHAPLLVLPDDLQDHSRSSLLVLDLGHIAFGRYDSIKGGDAGRAVEDFAADGLYAFSSPVPDGTGGAAPSSTRGGDESGVCEPGVLIDDPLSTNGQEDHTQNYWRLDVSGVQVVVADASSFLGADSKPGVTAALPMDTAIVEGFDLNVKIRTTTDTETNGLVGVRLEASLPRLSCNLHSSAYLLLTRLLKNELARPAKIVSSTNMTSHEDNSSVSSSRTGGQTLTKTAHEGTGAVASPATTTISGSHSGSSVGAGASKDGGVQGVPAAMRMVTSGRPARGIKTVLSSELEPVTEIPGEDGLDDTDDVLGVARGGPPRTPRRQSRSHRRRSSSGASSTTHASILEESGSGGEGTVEERGESSQGDDRYEEESQPPAGLVLELRVSAPLICVLLVHDHSTDRRGSDLIGAAVGDGSGLRGASAQKVTEDGTKAGVEGALVLAEICGLRIEYRDTIGGGDGSTIGGASVGQNLRAGGGGYSDVPTAGVAGVCATRQQEYEQQTSGFFTRQAALDHDVFPEHANDTIRRSGTYPYNLCLVAASFRVKDMHQRVTPDAAFSNLLSSIDPSQPPTLPPLLMPAKHAIRVTYKPAKAENAEDNGGSRGDSDGRSESRTEVTLGGLWANWNPETIAALSIFAYGMYGNSDGGARGDNRSDGGEDGASGNVEDSGADGERGMKSAQRSPSRATADDTFASSSSARKQAGAAVDERTAAGKSSGTGGVKTGQARDSELASVEAGTRGGVVVVTLGGISLWLNKEVHGRRLALLQAGESTIELSKYRHPEGSASKYSIVLGAASIIDLGTKDSAWRSMVSPSRLSALPRQEVRLDIVQDSRPNVEFPLGVSLVLQSCAAIYLNQTWLEVMDFVMNGVLGDGPWCPWLLVPEPKDGPSSGGEVLLRPPPPSVLKKKHICITARDTEVKLPAGHTGEDWATFGAQTLTASNSYEYRRMGESSVVKPELCQVWTICLDGLDIRSSRSSSPSENPEAASDGSGSGPGKNVPGVVPSPSPQVDPDSLFHLESTLLRSGGLSPGEVTLQAWWPVIPRIGAPESDGAVSNYVLVGHAPGLDLSLHRSDFSVLWQVLGENIAGQVAESADSLFAISSPIEGAAEANYYEEARRMSKDAEVEDVLAPGKGSCVTEGSTRAGVREGHGRNPREQLVVFPYEHPSATATTFDITFHLPDVALVAHDSREPGSSSAAPAASVDACGGADKANVTEGGGVYEVGKVRSTLLTWRMLRFSDFRSLNKVVMAEPLITESPPGRRLGESGGGHRKLLTPGQIVPLCFHPHPPAMGPNMPETSPIPTCKAESASAPTAPDALPEEESISVGIDRQGDGSLANPTEDADLKRAVSGRSPPGSGAGHGSSFRWKKMSWPDGGRTNSLAVSGASILLSTVGWNRWRAWASGATATDAKKGDDSNNRTLTGQPVKQPSLVVEEGSKVSRTLPKDTSAASKADVATAENLGDGNYDSSQTSLRSARGLEEAESEVAQDADLVADLAAALDIQLSQTCFVLEPWQYGGVNDAGEKDWEGGKNGAAVVVRVDMSMTMTSAFFLDGRWATQLGACDTDSTPVCASVSAVGDVRRHDDSPRTTLVSCRLVNVEAFSRPSPIRGFYPNDVLRDHRSRRPREAPVGRTRSARMDPTGDVPQNPEGGPSFLEEAEDVTARGWRTVLEPAAGTLTYAFSPPRSIPPTEKTAPAAAVTVDNVPGNARLVAASEQGYRRVSAEGWSAIRAVVRPSDVASVARVVSPTNTPAPTGRKVPEGGLQPHKEMRPPSSPPSVATPTGSSSVAADLSLLASGVGITVRLEDDSGTHFVSPPEPRPRHPEEDILPSVESSRHMQDGEELEEPPLPLSPRQGSLQWPPIAEVPWRAGAGLGRPPIGAVGGSIRSCGEDSMLIRASTLHRLRSASSVPSQPVVEASFGTWSVRYSRVSCNDGGNDGDDVSGQSDPRSRMANDGRGGAATTFTTAAVSISAVRVIDLLQRVPCHAAFRELLVIPAPAHRQQHKDDQTDGPSLPAVPVQVTRPASPSWQKWMEEEDELGQDIPVNESSADRGDGMPPLPPESRSTRVAMQSGDIPVPTETQHRFQSPTVQVPDGEDLPSVLISYRKVVSFGNIVATSSGDSVAGTPDCDVVESADEHRRVSATVDFEGPITANWNPRTFVALWGVRSALACSVTGSWGGGDPDIQRGAEASGLGATSGGEEAEVGDRHVRVGIPSRAEPEDSGRNQMRTSTPPVCLTEIRVAARRGLEMMFNKEKEGRQLMAVSAASLDFTMEASSGGNCPDNSAVIWNGQVKDLEARDPKGSNVLYSALVGRPSLSSVKEGHPAPPVALTFRYAKERGVGDLTSPYITRKELTPVGSPASEAPAPKASGISGPWESSVLSLSLTELQAVYVQPLWLEFIDFLWEGVLGTAVWGGSVEPETARGASKSDVPAAYDRKTSATGEAERDDGMRSLSQIHVTMVTPTVILPGSLTDPRHLALRPKSFRFSTWTGGPDDTNAPPQLQQCSPTGPVARHMSVDVPDCDIDFGLCSRGGAQESGAWQFHPLLKDPVDLKVTVKTESPATSSNDAEIGGGGRGSGPINRRATAGDGTRSGDESSPPDSSAAPHSSSERAGSAGDGAIGGGGEEAEQEKLMQIRVQLPRLLCMSLTPDARAALTGCIGGNVLAAGFHGGVSENFPLVAAAPSHEEEVARDISYSGAADEADEIDAEREGRREGGFSSVPASSTAAQRQQFPPPPPSSSGTAWESRGEVEERPPPSACPMCADLFDELLARHECAWCGGTVCRKCMHALALTTNDEDAPTESVPEVVTAEADNPRTICPSLVCDGCAARLFPETSLHPAGQVRFRYGDDGPVTALDVTLEVPRIQVNFLPLGSTLPLRVEEKEQERDVPFREVIDGGPRGNMGNMSVQGNGLELTYKRSARRRGGVEAALGAFSLVDMSPATVFSRIISPAPVPTTGEKRPPQVVLSYHFSPTTEAQIQVMVNHLEAIVAPSAIHELSSLAKPPPPPPTQRWDSGEVVDFSPVDAHRGVGTPNQEGVADSSEEKRSVMHDLAGLQLARDGDEDGAPKRPLTMKVTLLDPVLMLPQDDTDPDTKALFLQGLVMANYVRSPRYEKAFQQQQQPGSLGGGGSGSKEVATAEARDTSLQIIRLESQLGRMFGGSGRGPSAGGTGFSTSLGGLGEGAGAIDPVTLSLHYSEVERPLHPMVKDLKCQVEEVVCQFTYQDISLFNAVLSGWSSRLISDRNQSAAEDAANAGAGTVTAVSGDSSMLALAHTAAVAGATSTQGDADVAHRLVPGFSHAKNAMANTPPAFPAASLTLEGAAALGFEDDDDENDEEEEEEEEEEAELIHDGRFYDVVFETASLGIVLLRQDGVAVVEEVSTYKGVGGRAGGPFPGDELTEVAGVPTSCLSYDGVVDRIRTSPRPITLRFRRALFECWWGREYTLDLSSWDGHRLDGILLVGGGAGDQAVVGSADGYRPRKRVVTGVQPLRPRVGALVVSIAGIPVSHVNLPAVTSLLHELMGESSQATTAPLSRDGSRGGGGGARKKVAGGWTETTVPARNSFSTPHKAGQSRAGSAPGRGDGGRRVYQRPRRQRHQLLPDDSSSGGRRRRSRTRNVIRVVLREVDVHAWPPNWRHEVQCPGVRVTVIDDVEGRDMPLLRAEIGSLDMTHESGPGMARYSTNAGTRASPHTPPRGSATAEGAPDDDDALIVVPVSRTAAACDAQVDYYNATGGRWEPVLERVVAQGDREIVTRRPAPVLAESGAGLDLGGGIESGDRGAWGREGEEGSEGWRQEHGETCSVVRLSCFEEDVKVNVTHAALDVVLRALRDYKTIGGGSDDKAGSRQGADGSGGAIERSSGSPRLSRTVSPADPAARDGGGRGGGVGEGFETLGIISQQQQQQQQQRYSPFVLQNRTGLKLEFWAHQDKVDSVSRFGKRGTEVGGMSDQPFSTLKTADGQRQQAAARSRRHASWFMSLRLVPTSEDPSGDSGVVGVSDDVEGQQFLNLPLNEAGRSFLQCMLVMEGVDGLNSAGGDGEQQQPKRLSRCDAIWEVCLENGRHKVTLRSALEIVNNCGSWLEVRCSTESFAGGRADADQTREEVVGAVAPGGRLPLPLRWSRAEDIRLRPLVRRNQRETGGLVGGNPPSSSLRSVEMMTGAVESEDTGVVLTGGFEEGSGGHAFEYSDCSVLVPAARAGETELGVTMSVIPWVACDPSQQPSTIHEDTTTTATAAARKPLFLFLEGIDANDPARGRDASAPGGGSRNPSSTRALSSRRKRRGREGQHRAPASRPSPRATHEAGNPMAALSLRPLEVVVYASLSFRNLLPVGIGWRVAGERGDPGARVAEGWLGPGEGVHVLEANSMAMTPSLSFKIAGFDWSPPRQVAAAELQRPTRAGSGVGDSAGNNPGYESAGSDANEYIPGINLQSVPCRNMSNQILYLNVEAASIRVNSVLVTVFAGFWVRNLSGLPLTLGETVPRGLSAMEWQEERLAESVRDKARRYSPSPPRRSLWDVHPSAVQSDQHAMVEEVFELRLATKGEEMDDSYETHWMTAQGNRRPPCTQVRLPSKFWTWEDEWTIDFSGAVAPNAPGTAGGGWESCPRKTRGTSYSNSCFSSSRSFKLSEPVWRRRWVRRRFPCQPGSSLPRPSSTVAEESPPSGLSGTEGTSVIYQPAAGVLNNRNTMGFASARESESLRAIEGGGGLCVRVDDSAWSRPLNIAVQGAGGPFQVPGGRWPGLKRPAHPVTDPAELRRKSTQQRGRRSPTPSGQGGGKRGVWGEGDVGVYELAYDVRVAPAPWNRTRVITVASRYTVMNKCECVLVVKQYGSNVAMELQPGESRPLHWADGSLEATLSVSVISQAPGSTAATLMDWSGPVGIGHIGTFPICIRPMPGGAALPADSQASPPMSRASSPLSSRAGSSSASTPLSSPLRGGEGGASVMPVVGANRVLGVEVNIGRYSDGGGSDDSDRPVSGDGADGSGGSGGGQGFRSSAVQVIFQEEAWGMGDRFPTYRLENHTNSRMFYGQASVPGPGDALPPGRSCLFGWDQPCPAEERAQGVLNLSLVLAPEPLSSPEGKRQAKTLNIRKLGERTSLTTSRGRVEVVVEPDGPSKLVRMYNSKPFSIIPSPPRARIRPPQPVRSSMERPRTSPPYSNSSVNITGPPRSSRRLVGRDKVAAAPGSSSRSSIRRANTSPTPSTRGRGSMAGMMPEAPPSPPSRRRRNQPSGYRSPPPGFPPVGGAGSGGSGSGSGSSSEMSLRELHVFCRAVRVSIVDGDRGEVVLGSLERMSMSVAATDAEVEVKFKLGSLQIDSHLPGTSFPVLLQPVRSGYRGADNKCVRFTLVAATRVKNVTYIKLASLSVDEFDLRLDEGMVRWAQGLADRVMWDLAADRRADEMNDRWPLPAEAFCSSQALHLGIATSSGRNPDGGTLGGNVSSSGRVVSRGRSDGAFASRYVYLEVFQISSVKVRLSLQRAKDSFDNVYVGVKPGQMLLDLMMRMDSAHIKLKSLIVHNATTTRSRLMLTAREHYERELKQQAFLMLGSLEAFGNPVGLLRGMGQGMQDFVKEPVLGLLKSVEDLAPEELMHGMARGAGSLLNHSVGGVANSVSLITGTVSQNLTTLAMDKEYKLQRARRKDARGENRDVLDGIGSAGGSLARGLSDGVSGLIKNPLKGAESGGFAGFAKGVGTGMLGLVVKPVVGVTDAATDLLQGVRGTTASIAQIGKTSHSSSSSHHQQQQGGDEGHLSAAGGQGHSLGVSGGIGSSAGRGGRWEEGVGQVRPRRVLYGPERALRPYAIEDARAAAFLRGTRYKDEEYTAHLEIIQTAGSAAGVGVGRKAPSMVVVLTRSLVLLLRVPGGEVTLEQRLDGIEAVEIKAEGVLLHLRSPPTPTAQRQGSTAYPGLPPPPSEEDNGSQGRNRSRAQARGIPCADEALKRRLYELLHAAVKNATRLL